MAVTPIIPMLLLTVVTRCRADHTNGFNNNNGNGASRFGQLLKPPPPPPIAPIVPVPFHLGPERNHRHNPDLGYQYQALPPPPPPSEFKFPAPFYKQYNFNFVPQPQPFSTTPSPTMFQKVSEWLFPSQQTNYAESTIFNNNNNNLAPIKKDCNPCNLVPWLPVIRYNVGAKNVYQQPLSTYGPPNPTAYADALKAVQKYPQPFSPHNLGTKPPQLTPGIPHANYGPPAQKFNNGVAGTISSTYGPPSATHTLDISTPSSTTSTFSQQSSSYGIPDAPLVPYSNIINSQFLSSHSQATLNNVYNVPSSTYIPPSFSYATPSPVYGTPYTITNTYLPVTPQYDPGTLNKELPTQGDVELLENVSPIAELQVPKHNNPTTFKNSYGEPITNTNIFDISYPISATAAESSKIKTKVLPLQIKNSTTTNISFSLANPAPFTLNRGRNIHTLQPVALPNLSVSPLPPIFNARPFRPENPQFSPNILHGINHMQQSVSNVHIQQSIPLSEYTHSVDYPATIIQSPIIEIDAPTISNQTKGYRNIPNSYVVDEIRDISSQASESVSATKSISDASFETTGLDFGNDLYDSSVPVDLKQPSGIPSNHRPDFADLRGVNDEDLDKYRTENNLQNIDSPLLYLKPSAPHKNHGNFVLGISSPIPENEYEIYDDGPTTAAPFTPTLTNDWEENRDEYQEELSSSVQENKYKPKIVQIIVPYTTGNEKQEDNNDFAEMAQDWPSTPKDEYQARKVPSSTNNSYIYTATETYTTDATTTTQEPLSIPIKDPYLDQYHPTGTLKDLYEVKEPPFDIIKLQHTIDDWTEQEYSKQYKPPQKTRSSENYAKKIPDNYFSTSNYITTTSNYYNDFYDHEGSSSIQHSVTDDINNKTNLRPSKDYNILELPKNSFITNKQDQTDEVIQRLHIYTAASSFRTTSTSTTTTPAPWGKIQTSISPLTKEKVYVVTSKPWRESRNISKEWYDNEPFQSMKIKSKSEPSTSSNYPFKSPRFINRPSFDFTSGGKIESDPSYGFSRSWFQSINELETHKENDSASLPEARQHEITSNSDEDQGDTTATPRRGSK